MKNLLIRVAVLGSLVASGALAWGNQPLYRPIVPNDMFSIDSHLRATENLWDKFMYSFKGVGLRAGGNILGGIKLGADAIGIGSKSIRDYMTQLIAMEKKLESDFNGAQLTFDEAINQAESLNPMDWIRAGGNVLGDNVLNPETLSAMLSNAMLYGPPILKALSIASLPTGAEAQAMRFAMQNNPTLTYQDIIDNDERTKKILAKEYDNALGYLALNKIGAYILLKGLPVTIKNNLVEIGANRVAIQLLETLTIMGSEGITEHNQIRLANEHSTFKTPHQQNQEAREAGLLGMIAGATASVLIYGIYLIRKAAGYIINLIKNLKKP